MINTILERLKKVKDFRQNQSKRHEIWVVLSIIALSILTGNISYKQIEMFSNNN
ncbi:MAG: transposase family protein [Trichodesmium sp. MAG_R03]|nr:transposase family protein [Trichodesmium sp. MAG_R03]